MSTNKMWGGRFEAGPAAIMREINPSIDFDKRLAGEDLAGSRAHCRMLAAEGIISKDDAPGHPGRPDQIEKEIADGSFVFKRELEDIHLNIEARLAELIGPTAGAAHRALAQRPGGDGFPALGARGLRARRPGPLGAAAGAG